MEFIVAFKGKISEIKNYDNIVVALEHFSIATDFKYSKTQFEAIVQQASEDNVGVYVLCNKMIFDEDLEVLESHLEWLHTQNIKGIYFSDMAVYMLAKKLNMVDLLIYSPGMTIVNSEDVKAYLSLGLQAVELANELTLDEKIMIAKHNPHQVGIVISGYMLMSFSKRKNLSNYFNFIEKEIQLENNFDLRLIERTRDGLMPTYEDEHGAYIFSEYVLHSLNVFEALVNAPFKYFKIDGIFLSQDVVLEMFEAYKKCVIDPKAFSISDFEVKFKDIVFDDRFYHLETSEVK